MDADSRFQKWQEWLNIIYSDIQQLLINRHIFNEVQEIISSNPQIQIGSAFYNWMGTIYPAAMVMGVRRQLDNRNDCISLVRLLKEIKKNPKVLTRKRYLSMYNDSSLPDFVPNTEFDSYCDGGKEYIDLVKVNEDLINLKFKAEKIKSFATKRIAHFDKEIFEDFPSYGELDAVLDYLEEIFKKYSLVLRADTSDLLPIFLYDWKKIFRYPWIVSNKRI